MTDKPAMVGKFKSFISESEIEEKRKKRQEEWEKVRQPGQSLEAPEEVVDTRTLYERLQQQKDKKQEEYDEAHKFKNQIRGLDNEEADFLSHVSNRQTEIVQERYKEEEDILNDFKKATTEVFKPVDVTTTHPTLIKVPIRTNIKSQYELLSGAIKRKRSDEKITDAPSSKLGKNNDPDANNELVDSVTNTSSLVQPSWQSKTDFNETFITNSTNSILNNEEIKISKNGRVIRNEDIEAKVIGYLPGIGDYSEGDSDDSDSSGTNSEIEIKSLFPPIIRIKDVQKAINQGNH